MRKQDIIIGKYYRHKNSLNYGWAKAIKVLNPKEKPNKNTYSVVKCEWTLRKDDSFGLIKYFKPSDLVLSTSKAG